MSRRLITGALLALLPVTLAGCSKDSGEAAVKAAQADPAAHPGGVLRVGILRPVTVDPQLLSPADTAAQLVVRTMCDPLIGTDPESRELSPAIAKSWRVLGASGLQVSVRKGLRFSDGTPLTARDVRATLIRVANPDVVSPSAPLLQHVIGWQDVQDGKREARALAGIKATTGSTIQVNLDRDDSQFIYALAQPFATPVPGALAATAGFSSHPVCSGPYRLAGDYTGVEPTISLTRTPGYKGVRPSLTRSGAGWADRIDFRIMSSTREILAAIKRGDLDAGQLGGDQISAAGPAGVATTSVPTGRLEYVGLPNKGALPQVAAGLSRALDRETINQRAFAGARLPAYNLVPPTLPDSVLPKDKDLLTCGIGPHGDPSAGRNLLGHLTDTGDVSASVAELPFYFNDEFHNRALVQELASQWAAAGVALKLKPTPVTFENMIARGEGSGGFDGLFRMTATANFADLADFVLPLVSIDALGRTNYAGYNGEQIARVVRNRLMAAVPVDEQRTQSLGVLSSLCDVPVVPIAWYQTHLGYGSNVVVAAHRAVDRAIGLPELRELAVG